MPLLRSPPFPGVPVVVAAVSGQGTSRTGDLPAMIEAIRAARVGGSFWGPPVVLEGEAPVVVRARTPGEIGGLITRARMVAGRERPIVACLPRRLGMRVPGVRFVFGEVDPWSLLGPGATLLAPAGDEWRAIAAIAGAALADGPPPDLARLLLGAAYRDPFTAAPARPEQTVAILADWRRTLDANRGIAVASGMAWWKKRAVARFLWTARETPLGFVDDARRALRLADGETIAVWPSRMPPGLAESGAPLIRVEDGFIRSIGLGSDLHPPHSVVVDRRGIYYDPRRPSDLEVLLETATFPPALVARAEALARRMVTEGVSKYGRATPAAPSPRSARRTVLVPGQVEDDMSVRSGGGGVAGNLDLLARVRAAEPDAYILYKPHPDVDAGHRAGRVADTALLEQADEIVRGVAMPTLLARVDAVHVWTSLTGFEALLRGLPVTTHGQPFFAGWGLTDDRGPALPRRTRRLRLVELVAGVLILYPRYLDPVTNLPCPPEVLLDRFARQAKPKRTLLIRARQLQGKLAKLAKRRR